MTVRLRQCCCGCSLKEGTLVIAVICLLLSIGAFLSTVYYIVHFAMHYQQETSWYIRPEVNFPVLVIVLLLCLTELVTSSLLLRGILKYDRRLVMPWLVANAMMCGLLFLIVVGGTVTCFIATANQIKNDLIVMTYGLIVLAVGAVIVGVYVYFLLVVYSYYCLLPMLSSRRIAILLNRFKNPYFHHEDEGDHVTTEGHSVTSTPRFLDCRLSSNYVTNQCRH